MHARRDSSRAFNVAVLGLALLTTYLLSACASPYGASGTHYSDMGPFSLQMTTDRLASDTPGEFALFGSSVAIDAATVVIGAWGADDHGRNTGAVYVYEFVGDSWIQVARLTAPDAEAGARFGHAVAVDGDTILIGAIYHSGAGARAGAVYVFERGEGSWVHESTLLPSSIGTDAYFGKAVDLSGDTAVIGASGPTAKSAFVYERTDGGWLMAARLEPVSKPSPGWVGARFGSSVAIHGSTLVVGADSGSEQSDASGSAYVFERDADRWLQTAVLEANSLVGASRFGFSVALERDTAVVGAPGDDEAVWVFHRSPDTWVLEEALRSPTSGVTNFGHSVALEGDKLVVGAPGARDSAGAAYVFERAGGYWNGVLEVVPPAVAAGTQLAVAVGVDQGTIVMGATGDTNGGLGSGAAYTLR